MSEETRERFEKWATRETGYPFPLELARLGNDYKYSDTRFAFLVWQAAKADTPAERPAPTMKHTYKVFPDKEFPMDWRVRAILDDGDAFLAIFSGLEPESRAREYASWKNGESVVEAERPAEDWMKQLAKFIADNDEIYLAGDYEPALVRMIARFAPLPPKSEEPR